MDLLNGLLYNVRGLRLGLTTGILLFWGIVRFALIIVVMLALTGIILSHHAQIMDLLWARPGNPWIIWLWHLLSWLITLFLMGLAALFSYLISQVLFSVVIMDHMSRITEMKVTGHIRKGEKAGIWKSLFHLVGQEIPRTLLPVLLSLMVMILGWLTPMGPLLIVITSAMTVAFLAWDYTDLVPARHRIPFKIRLRSFLSSSLFHLGFGLPFLIPLLNILFLSCAPVGATLYYIDRVRNQRSSKLSSSIASQK